MTRHDVTFGELAIGEAFAWRDTAEIQHGPPGPEPMTKVDDAHYTFRIHGGRALDGQWPDGTPMHARGTAEPHYPVRRTTRATEGS